MFNLGLFVSYAVIVTFTPGPNNIMSLYNASQNGFKKNVSFSLGVSAGFLILLTLCSFLNYGLNQVLPKIQPIMSLIGASYMLYLAYKIFSSKPPEDMDSKSNVVINFKTGVMMQFINPKAILFGITIISTFIMPYFSSWYMLLLFSLFLSFLAFLSTSLWAISGSLLTKFLKKYHKPFNIVMSLLLVYTAVSISGLLH